MDTNYTPHLAHAQSGNIPGLWQGRCSCGWRGPVQGDEGQANADAGAHMRRADPVEEARERALAIIRRYSPSTVAETPLERAQRDA